MGSQCSFVGATGYYLMDCYDFQRNATKQVWQEFWITGDVDGRGGPISNPDGPLDHDLFMLCARATIKLLRNHPSLALWVGGNEQVPPDDVNTALKSDLKLDPYFMNLNEIGNSTEELSPILEDPSQYLDGACIYVQGSLWDGFANGKGDFTDSPYEIQNPTFLRMTIISMDLTLRLVLLECLLQLLSGQQCLQRDDGFLYSRSYQMATQKKCQIPYGNTINTFPIQNQT